MANPQKIALPQAYDEFLIQDELRCIVDGCDWTGRHLSQHVNLVHGITARDFKEMAGFNRSTGLVCIGLSESLRGRPYAHLRRDPEATKIHMDKMRAAMKQDGAATLRRLESRELSRKYLAERRATPSEVTYTCARCQTLFVKVGIKRVAKYCDPCRQLAHAELHAKNQFPLTCSECRCEFVGNAGQRLRAQKGRGIYCPACLEKIRAAQLVKGRSMIPPRPKNIPERGPCPTCGVRFRHYAPSKFCSRACYQASDGFQEMRTRNLAAINAKRRRPTPTPPADNNEV